MQIKFIQVSKVFVNTAYAPEVSIAVGLALGQ